MKFRVLIPLFLATGLSACGAPPPEKAILGTWLQETPTSTTESGLQSTTSQTALTFEKDGDARLVRQLDLAGAGLPPEGISLDVDLSGTWVMGDGQIIQTLENATITPRSSDPVAADIALQLQSQADTMAESRKDIVALDRQQLILQDAETGATDVYRRK